MKRAAAGFSAIELMAVVAIVSVLALVALPNMNQMIAATRVKSASSSLYIALTKARSEAVKRNASVTIEPVSGTDWDDGFRIRLASDATKVYGNEAAMKETVSVVTNPSPLTSIVYLRSGRVKDNATPTLQITDGKSGKTSRCIMLDSSGRPYVKEATC